jgi:hypothetical protein
MRVLDCVFHSLRSLSDARLFNLERGKRKEKEKENWKVNLLETTLPRGMTKPAASSHW